MIEIIIVIITVVIVIGLTIELYRSFFSHLKTQEIEENLYVVKSTIVNFYVYVEGEEVICFDAGYSSKRLIKELKKIEIKPEEVTYVFLTHADTDHAGGLKYFEKAKVYLSKDEEQMINGKTSRFPFYKNKRIKEYELLNDGEEVRIGEAKIEAISTPGHTPGSMSYLLNDEVLFTGDTISIRGGKIRHFYRLINMDTKEQKKSIRKIAERKNIKMICTAHTGITREIVYAKNILKIKLETRIES